MRFSNHFGDGHSSWLHRNVGDVPTSSTLLKLRHLEMWLDNFTHINITPRILSNCIPTEQLHSLDITLSKKICRDSSSGIRSLIIGANLVSLRSLRIHYEEKSDIPLYLFPRQMQSCENLEISGSSLAASEVYITMASEVFETHKSLTYVTFDHCLILEEHLSDFLKNIEDPDLPPFKRLNLLCCNVKQTALIRMMRKVPGKVFWDQKI